MPKFKVFNCDEHDKEVYFKLEARQDGTIALVACDNTGTRLKSGTILAITSDGYLRQYRFVDNTIGLQLDGDGKLKLEK